MKLCPEGMTAVGAARVNAKRECVDHVVEELHGVLLGVARMRSSTAHHLRRSPMSRAYPRCSLFERLTHTEDGLGRQTPSA